MIRLKREAQTSCSKLKLKNRIATCITIACIVTFCLSHRIAGQDTEPKSTDTAINLEGATVKIADRISKFLLEDKENLKNYEATITEILVKPVSKSSVKNTNGEHIRRQLEKELSERKIRVNKPGICSLSCTMRIEEVSNAGDRGINFLIYYKLDNDTGDQLCKGSTAIAIRNSARVAEFMRLVAVTGSAIAEPLAPETGSEDKISAKDGAREDGDNFLQPSANGSLAPIINQGKLDASGTRLFASENSDYSLEILVKRKNKTTGQELDYVPVPIIFGDANTEPQVKLQEGDLFAVKLYNTNSIYDAGVELTLDGTNSLFLCKQEFKDQKWVISRNNPGIVDGFLLPKNDTGRREKDLFRIGDRNKRLADATRTDGLPDGGANHGTITAIFFGARDKTQKRSSHDAELIAFAGDGSSLEVQRGPRVESNEATKEKIFEKRPLAIITVRYEAPNNLPELPAGD